MTHTPFLLAVVVLLALTVACSEPNLPTATPEPTFTPHPTPTPSVAEIFTNVGPGVVRILTRRSEGSGIIVRSDGMILTANHLVEGIRGHQVLATVDVVTSYGKRLKGYVVCQNPVTDLAIVHVKEGALPVVPLGDSAALVPGADVIKMGYALNLPGTVSIATGIVSAIRRDGDSGATLIQTDAPLSPGDSGGPLLDKSGRVIGVNSMKWVGRGIEGVGFALGINEAKRTLLHDLDKGVNCVMPPLGVPVTSAPGHQEFPDISGNIVVWTDNRRNIRGYNLATKQEFQVSSAAAQGLKYIPRVSGNIVVWGDTRNGNGDIYGYDVQAQREFPISTNPSNQWSPDVNGGIVVWQDDRNGNWDIYGYDLDTQTEFQITTDKADQQQPRISGDIVIWQDRRNDQYTGSLCPGPRCDRNPDAIVLYGYDLKRMTEFPWPFRAWVIDGDLVAGTQDTPMGDRITVFNIRSQKQVARWLVPRDAIDLAISGDIVVWADNREDTFDSVYGYDLRSRTVFLVAKGVNVGIPAIYGDFVVWHAIGDSNDLDIYGKRISR